MRPAPLPFDEAERQERLDSIRIIDTPPEQSFDDITSLASEMCDAPVALVAFFDHDRYWFKSRVNLGMNEAKRDDAFCTYAIEREEPLIIDDLQADPRFADSPYVTNNPNFRFYCGVPLRAGSGSAVGTLCILDYKPRALTPKQVDVLRRLGRQIERELQSRKQTRVTAPPPLTAPLRVGEVVDGYTVKRAIKEGGAGALFEAVGPDGTVAIKVLLGKWSEREAAYQRFVREARILRKLTSKHICKLLDVGNLDPAKGKLPYLVLEYLDGVDLAELHAQKKKLAWRDVVGWLADACVGLAEAHGLGIIHRDIKPSNIFLVGTTPKVLDFGIATSEPFDPMRPVTKDGNVFLGTLVYMPPEQLMRPSEVDPRSDIWSMGVTLFELVTGSLPFAGDSDLGVCSNILMHEAPPLRSLDATLPVALEELVAKALLKDPSGRFATIRELEASLRALL